MGTRVLIVEDEQLVAADLEAKIQRLGHQVVGCAASGLDAIRLAEQTHPELVLMDIKLQGEMDGVEAAKRLKAAGETKIIFVSAFGHLAKVNEGMALIGTCLTKPYSYSQLQAAVDATLGKNHAEQLKL